MQFKFSSQKSSIHAKLLTLWKIQDGAAASLDFQNFALVMKTIPMSVAQGICQFNFSQKA